MRNDITEITVNATRKSGTKFKLIGRVIGKIDITTLKMGNGQLKERFTMQTEKGQRVLVELTDKLVTVQTNNTIYSNGGRITEYSLESYTQKTVTVNNSLWN